MLLIMHGRQDARDSCLVPGHLLAAWRSFLPEYMTVAFDWHANGPWRRGPVNCN